MSGLLYTGSKCLFVTRVSGRSLVASPPAKMTPLIYGMLKIPKELYRNFLRIYCKLGRGIMQLISPRIEEKKYTRYTVRYEKTCPHNRHYRPGWFLLGGFPCRKRLRSLWNAPPHQYRPAHAYCKPLRGEKNYTPEW